MIEKNINISINSSVCFMCGKAVSENRVRAHLLPKSLNPKYHIFCFLHKECERRINNLYVNQQKKREAAKVKKKALNLLEDFKIKIKIMEDRIKKEK